MQKYWGVILPFMFWPYFNYAQILNIESLLLILTSKYSISFYFLKHLKIYKTLLKIWEFFFFCEGKSTLHFLSSPLSP